MNYREIISIPLLLWNEFSSTAVTDWGICNLEDYWIGRYLHLVTELLIKISDESSPAKLATALSDEQMTAAKTPTSDTEGGKAYF